MELEISNIEFHLNFPKKLSGKICIELNITNVEFHLSLDFVEFKKHEHFVKKFQNMGILLHSL